MSAPIPFTQYLLPDGRTRDVSIDCGPRVNGLAHDLIRAGFRFECEMLRDMATISLTLVGPNLHGEEDDLEIEVIPNGRDVPVAVRALVEKSARTRLLPNTIAEDHR